MSELANLSVEIAIRSSLITAVAALSCVLLACRFPRAAQRTGAVACIALIGLPFVLLVTPRIDLAPGIARVTASAWESETTKPVEAAALESSAPWNNIRYHRANPRLPFLLLTAYALGVLVTGTRLARSWLKVRRIARACTRSTDERARRLAAQLTKSGAAIVTHPDCHTPLALGILKPKILLPGTSTSWPLSKLTACLAHEVAHVRNRDPLWLLVAHLATALYWFHPGVWLLKRQMRVLAETASDDEAIDLMGDARSYVRGLLDFSIEANSRRHGARVDLAHSIAQSPVAQRIHRILDRSRDEPVGWRYGNRAALAIGVALVAIVVLVEVSDVTNARPLEESALGRPLLHALAAGDAQSRADALFRLARWTGRESQAVPLLVAHLGDDTPIDSMPRWDFASEGWSPAWPTFTVPSPGEVAALGLASMGSKVASELTRSLGDADPVVRRNAAWALGELRHPRGISRDGRRALADALTDTDPSVRVAAVWALGDIADVRYLPEVRTMLAAESHPRARQAALETLRALEAGHSLEVFRLARNRS